MEFTLCTYEHLYLNRKLNRRKMESTIIPYGIRGKKQSIQLKL